MIDTSIFALLLLGHVLADFAFQPSWMVNRKYRPSVILTHGAIVLASHALILLPFLDYTTLRALFVVAVGHVVIDASKQWVQNHTVRKLWPFVVDQALHLGLLISAAAWLGRPDSSQWLVLPEREKLGFLALAASAFIFNVQGGSAVVRFTLQDLAPADGGTRDGRGAIIGVLERWLILTLVLVSQWAAVGLVLAAKSLARFEELKDRRFAEYYLVGTLTSVLVAVASGLFVHYLMP